MHRESEWKKYIPEILSFNIGGIRFLLVHEEGRLPYSLPQVDVIICGHTHIYQNIERRGIIYLNPGSLSQSRGTNLSMAVITINSLNINIEKIYLDKEY